MRFDKFCQSCMLPKKHDLFEVGTEKDGSNNNDYCKLCYVEGEFTQLEIKSGKQMQEFVNGVLKEQVIGKVKRWFYTCSIPQLKRWKKRKCC